MKRKEAKETEGNIAHAVIIFKTSKQFWRKVLRLTVVAVLLTEVNILAKMFYYFFYILKTSFKILVGKK